MASKKPRRLRAPDFPSRQCAFVGLTLLLGALDVAWADADSRIIEDAFETVGRLQSGSLVEVSGMQAGPSGVFYVHNDDGRPALYLVDERGRHLGSVELVDAKNRDWEDLARVPYRGRHLLVAGDIGNNHRRRRKARLYFFEEPRPGPDGSSWDLAHTLKFDYPDGPRDAEALAYDPAGDRLLILTKRDRPPRLYAIALEEALEAPELEAASLGTLPPFRPPTVLNLLTNPNRGFWVSQPTGMDISPDGRLAAVITYRSLYLFRRQPDESWVQAFQRPPLEYVGPPGFHDEAVTFGAGGDFIYVTTEKRPAPVYRLRVPGREHP